MIGMSERECFRTWEIQELTGLSDRQIGYYIRTGLLGSLKQANKRVYSWRDLFEALTIVELRKSGVSIQALRSFFPALREWLGQFPAGVLGEGALIVQPAPSGLADAFLVQSPEYAKRLKSLRVFVMVNFKEVCRVVAERDATGHEISGTVAQGAKA